MNVISNQRASNESTATSPYRSPDSTADRWGCRSALVTRPPAVGRAVRATRKMTLGSACPVRRRKYNRLGQNRTEQGKGSKTVHNEGLEEGVYSEISREGKQLARNSIIIYCRKLTVDYRHTILQQKRCILSS